MQADAVVKTMAALLDADDDDVTQSFLLAAVYCRAIRTGVSPRSVVENLFKAMPDCDAWPPLRDALVATIDG